MWNVLFTYRRDVVHFAVAAFHRGFFSNFPGILDVGAS